MARQDYAANIIADAIYTAVDDEGRKFLLLKEIIDFRKLRNAIEKNNMWVQSREGGNKHMRKTTIGWELCIQWKDDSTSWEPLANLKDAYPVEVAEFAIAHNIASEPAFAWWVPDVMHRKERIVKATKTRYLKRMQKFGIDLPKSVNEALRIDKETKTTYWADALAKELKNSRIAFKFLLEGDKAPVGYTFIRCHWVFDVKMDFTRKARLVAGGHMTDPPTTLTYSSVVSRDSVRLGFLLAALNDLDILAGDIGNAYLNAETKEKVYTVAGPEFGEMEGRTVVIVRALYGLKSSAAAWHEHLTNSLHDLGFKPSYADPDVWMKPAVKPCGFKYYEYIFIYVDDVLVLSHRAKQVMNAMSKMYRFKEGSIGPPTMYLGAHVVERRFPEDAGKVRWALSSEQYLKDAVKNLELKLVQDGLKLPGRKSTPMTSGYRPELDYSPLLSDEAANYYQQLIGIIRWAVELGRLDVFPNVVLLSSYLMQPRVGHLQEVYHIFSYLKHNPIAVMVFDDRYVEWNEADFPQYDWSQIYRGAEEAIPPNMPEPRGRAVQINCFVDADHAGNRVTRRSHTGVLIFVNRAPILWYSKAQNTVETSTFGSEFIATKIAVELLEGLRYKIRMFGVPLEGAANLFCDNQSVVLNATVPSSTLKKKHNAIAYHRVREAIAAKTVRVAKVLGEKNLADLFTKLLPGPRLYTLIRKILYYPNAFDGSSTCE
jgi:hypothetical protein